MAEDRLQKVLAAAGFGSRRHCGTLVAAGQVTVDGEVVTEPGARVDPVHHRIACAGRPVRLQPPVTLVLNKPRRVLCTVRDDRGRRTVLDLVRGIPQRIFPVGRLDWESQGLVLLTNDGELANLLTHPRYGVPRTYHVILKGDLTGEVISRIQKGVWLAEGKTGPVRVLVKKRAREGSVLEVTLGEGMNREVRRIFARFGLRVRRLKRIRVGSLGLGALREGQYRLLTPREVEDLKAAARPGGRAAGRQEGRRRW